MGCTGLLFPRIEGLIRANHIASGCTTGFKQEHLAASAVGLKFNREASLDAERITRALDEAAFQEAHDFGEFKDGIVIGDDLMGGWTNWYDGSLSRRL